MTTSATAPAMAPDPDRSRPMAKWAALFGYDLFISYKRGEATRYARALTHGLVARDFTCFFDEHEAPAAYPLSKQINSGLKRTKTLVLIATQQALASEFVRREISAFRMYHKRRSILILSAGGCFSAVSEKDPVWGELRSSGMIWIDVRSEDIVAGRPDEATVDAIEAHFTYRRGNRTRRIVTGIVMLLLMVLASIAIYKAYEANENAVQALSQKQLADAARLTAEDLAEKERQARQDEQAQRKRAEVGETEANKQATIARQRQREAEDATGRALIATRRAVDAKHQEEQALRDALLGFPRTAPKGWQPADELGIRRRLRPLRPGASIGFETSDAPAGTLCCLVRDSNGKRYLLVLASLRRSLDRTQLLQPGQIDDPSPRDERVVARFIRSGADELKSGLLAELRDGIEFDPRMPIAGGRPIILGMPPVPGRPTQVHILGRGSGLVIAQAIVEGDEIQISSPRGAVFSEPGDAGALVLDLKLELIGLIWGGAGNRAFGVSIHKVLNELGVTLIGK